MSPPSDSAFVSLQTALAGRFFLETELGRGGMGVVYLARDVILERPVAIKLLASSWGAHDDMRRRFLREARIAAQCFHPHIVPIHEVAESGDLAWFVMGYVKGETLADRLRRTGPLPADAIRRIGREIGWALSYAHERGVVHRDVKPENILLEQGSDRALIVDFGIAWSNPGGAATASAAHSSGEVAGTARFMAPEQALGDKVDGRADLYALGVTLYLAASGHYPFEGASALAIMAQQAVSRAPSVRTRARALPDSIADAIDQCVAPKAAERFDSVAAFVTALERTPQGDELPSEVRDVRAGARSTLSLIDWSVAIVLASVFLVMGEEARSLGRSIMIGIVQGVAMLAGSAIVLRTGETLFAARRALRNGVAPEVVIDALAPLSDPAVKPVGPLRGIAMLSAAFLLALAQGSVDRWSLQAAELLLYAITWLVPPVLIHRAMSGMRKGSGLSGWLHAFVKRPIASKLVGWLGGARRALSARPIPANAPTEVLLGHAADEIFARLPEGARRDLHMVPAAAAALAREAIALRSRDRQLSDAQRVLRAQTPRHDQDNAARLALDQQRAVVQGRLGSTIAALEAIRLDLLRLDAGVSDPAGITEHLEVVRELQRRVDAVADVHEALAPRQIRLAPEPTPV